jgi:hypothetical protein
VCVRTCVVCAGARTQPRKQALASSTDDDTRVVGLVDVSPTLDDLLELEGGGRRERNGGRKARVNGE